MTTATVRPPFATGNANEPPGKFTELPDPEFIDLAVFGKGPPAARLGDSVSHLSLIAVLLVAAAAVVIVVAVGAILLAAAPIAAVGGMIAGTVAFSASTIAAAGAIVSVTLIGGALLGGATADIVEGEAAESSGGLLSTPTGKIIKGATSVFINSRPAVPATTSMALCSKEKPPTVLVAQGSDSVDVESQGAARNGDKTVCGAAISGETSPDVYIGGGQKSFLAVDDDLGFFRATFAVMKWTGAAAGLAAGAVGIGAAFATGGFLAGVGALSEMAIGMFIVGPAMKWAGESGMEEALDAIGIGENSHLHRTLTELGGGLAELIPINLRSTKPSDRVEGSIREIELGLDKIGGKLFKFGTGKDFELPPALKAWNERVSSDLARRLGLDKAMLKANLFAMLHGPLPDDYVPSLPKPDPIIFEMPPAPARRTGFSDGSNVRPSDYVFETVSGTITESGAKPSPGNIDDKPGLIITLPDNAPALKKQDVDFVSVKAPKNKSERAGDKAEDAIPPTTGPGSASHKAARWASYQERGGKWSYNRWSKQYDVNMTQASKANKAMDAYRDKIGWGEREVSVKLKLNGETITRRLDIADKAPGVKKAIEHKTGYQSLTKANEYEIARDAALQNKRGWSIEWVFEGKPSKPLLEALDRNGISYIIIGN